VVVVESEVVVYEVPVYSNVPPVAAVYHFTPLPFVPVVAERVTAPVPQREALVGDPTVPGTTLIVTEVVAVLPDDQQAE
jgi:hypothetical protein